MTQFAKVIAEIVRPPDEKQVTAILYDSELNEARRTVLNMQLAFDAKATIEVNFVALWESAISVNLREWLAREDEAIRTLYADVAVAALEAAKSPSAILSDVNNAMEAVITASPRAGQWQKLVTMASTATAAQRERFYLLIGFLVLRDLLDKQL